MINISDDVILSAKNEECESFSLIVESCQNAVFNLCFRMLANERDAEDAAQETFWKAWTSLSSYDLRRSFSTWILAIAAHYCIDQMRKKKLITVDLDDSNEEIISDIAELPAVSVLRHEQEEKIQRLLSVLQDVDRAAVLLRYWYGFSEKEIAENLNFSESALKSRLFRARKVLAQKWMEEKDENDGLSFGK